ncbi:uncharacterized protein LOC132753999 isoform X1 [Ruditapes philippinarum]|uniref:uncharacterized protein LOC132753999 isoform X1 n=1 Tax=Ruditapes philippinarum TaxID=129788 RepID=UPI00295B7969|nr:uncharacterized protein LOC132753999 isoform X1 [Ruditapes philippinarum]XP_060600566.1 uncharacterized protein LOC132753999 isoform X1 [Ruditapes philippinarum]
MGSICCKCRKIKNNDLPTENIGHGHNAQTDQIESNGYNGQNGRSAQHGHTELRDEGIDGAYVGSETSWRRANTSMSNNHHSRPNRALNCRSRLENNGILVIDNIEEITKTSDQIREYNNDIGNRRQIFRCNFTPISPSIGLKRSSMPAGNFIDCRGANDDRRFVYIIKEWAEWSHSVCQIRFPNGTATGFRVGSRYIMTAFHVVSKIHQNIPGSREYIDDSGNLIVESLIHLNVFCLFGYYRDGPFPNNCLKKFFFKPVVKFLDENTDTVVIELADDPEGNQMPPPFELFSGQGVVSEFTLIGHNGGAMEHNTVDQVIDRDSTTTFSDIQWVKNHSLEQARRGYECPPHSVLLNKQRILFHCKFSKGASGTPGIIVQEDGRAVVATMLLCGYPDWYYDIRVEERIRSDWPQEYCIEQGADMISVGKNMAARNPYLYQDIFCRHLPEPLL